MTYGTPVLIGAAVGATGPILWTLALRSGHHIADGSGILEKVAWIFPCSILFLGFPEADAAHPRIQVGAALTVGLVNVIAFACLAAALTFIWRLVSS